MKNSKISEGLKKYWDKVGRKTKSTVKSYSRGIARNNKANVAFLKSTTPKSKKVKPPYQIQSKTIKHLLGK